MTGWDRKEELKDKAMEACRLINPENPVAAAEAMPEIWRALNDALPIIEAEADQRDDAGQAGRLGGYWSETRDLADRIEALILKATAKD